MCDDDTTTSALQSEDLDPSLVPPQSGENAASSALHGYDAGPSKGDPSMLDGVASPSAIKATETL